ncbi:MAG: hypothetical protein C4291_05775 [Candidatus Dadabacteria bacterium]
MKRKYPDQITFIVNIPAGVYGRVLNFIKTHELEETGAIQKIISAGLLKLEIDMIKEENASLSGKIGNLWREIKRFIEENSRLEKLCIESQRDSDYIYKRLEILNSENKELKVLVRQQSSADQK